MNSFEQVLYLIEHFLKGEYLPLDYASQLTNIYFIHNDGSVTDEIKTLLSELVNTAEYFSDSEDDLNIPDAPFTDINKLTNDTKKAYSLLKEYYKIQLTENINESIYKINR